MFTPRFISTLTSIIMSLVEAIISLRIVLKLFGANANAPFVMWIYETSRPLLTPFEGMFPTPRITEGLVIEISSLFALIVYAFAGYLIEEGIKFFEAQSERAQRRARKD